MKEEDPIRVRFCTPESDFGEVLGRALGPDFTVMTDACEDADLPSGWEDGYDCVLLDLRDLPVGAGAEDGTQHLEKFRRTESAPPIVVLAVEDGAAFLRQFVEAGAYDVLDTDRAGISGRAG